jgi:hypothetical protein
VQVQLRANEGIPAMIAALKLFENVTQNSVNFLAKHAMKGASSA